MKIIIFFLTIFSFVSFVGIIFLEIIFGNWVFNNEWRSANYLNIIRDKQIEITIKDLEKENSDYKIIYTKDIYGLRSSCKYKKNIDILTMGGSTTDQRYISDKNTFQEILQQKITKELNKKICIFNAGVDGHSTHGHIKSFNDWFNLIPGFNPKIIFLYIGINDAGIKDEPSLYDYRNYDNENILKKIYYESVFLNALRRLKYITKSLLTRNVYGDHLLLHPKDIYKFTATESTKEFDKIILKNTINFEKRLNILLGQISKYDSKVVCITQPHFLVKRFEGKMIGINSAITYQNKNYNGLDFENSILKINQVMKKKCEFYIEISADNFSFQKDFYDPVHMLPSGSKKLASIIFEEMRNQKIIYYLENTN